MIIYTKNEISERNWGINLIYHCNKKNKIYKNKPKEKKEMYT